MNAVDDGPVARLDSVLQSSERFWQSELFSQNPARLKTMLGLKGERDPFSEWHAYHELKNAVPAMSHELFLGLFGDTPRLAPLSTLAGHTYILGGTGTGKTSIAVTQLLLQVDRTEPTPPIIIFDLKPEGDRYLRGVAEMLAAHRGAPLAFFSNRGDYKSLEFDPLQALASLPGIKALAQTYLRALIPIRTEKADEVFFLNENRQLLEQIFDEFQGKSKTFEDLIEEARKRSREAGGNREARGLHGALSDFVNMPHVRIGKQPDNMKGDLDFGRVLSGHQIAYIHLDSQSLGLASRSVGRLMLSCILAEAVNRKVKRLHAPDFYVFIDEFHELASSNVADLLTVARSAGARLILSHQSTASLGADSITDVIMQNTSLQMLLSPDDKAVEKAFERVAGEKIEIRHGGSKGTSFKQGASRSEMNGRSSSYMKTTNELTGMGSTSQGTGTSQAVSNGFTHGLDQSRGETWQEERVSALTPNMFMDLDATQNTAMVRVRKQGPGSGAATPWRGIAVLNLLYPFTVEQKNQFEEVPWPTEILKPRQPTPPKDAKKSFRPKAEKTPLNPEHDASASALEARLAARDKPLKKAKGSPGSLPEQ